jgi:hypothetical protein
MKNEFTKHQVANTDTLIELKLFNEFLLKICRQEEKEEENSIVEDPDGL